MNIATIAPDRANELAKEVLAEINRLGAMCGNLSDPTSYQELAVSHYLRKYHIEKIEELHRHNMAAFDEIGTMLAEVKTSLVKALGPTP